MIRGEISIADEAVIPLQIRASDGQTRGLDSVIDTGFSGYLTLTPADIATFQLPFQQRQTYVLGDGNRVEFDVYLATILWDGRERDVAVLASEGGALIGMKMLRGYRVFLNVIDGGEVRIERQDEPLNAI